MKAATGEEVSAEELGGAEVHTRLSGVADYLAEDDEHALEIARQIVWNLHGLMPSNGTSRPPEPPAPAPEDCTAVPSDARRICVREVIARLVDDSDFDEYKARYAKTLVYGFARLGGYPVGIIAQQWYPLLRERAKGGALIELCRAAAHPAAIPAEHHRLYGRPGCTRMGASPKRRRQNGEGGGERGRAEVHGRDRRIVRAGALTAMCGRAYGPRQLWMWPNARISVMGGEQAAIVLTMVGDADADEIRATYEAEGNPYYSTARLWDDGIIDPRDTRRVLALGISAALNAPVPESTFGIFRM